MKERDKSSKDTEETLQNEIEKRRLRKSRKYEKRYKRGGPRRTVKKRKGSLV